MKFCACGSVVAPTLQTNLGFAKRHKLPWIIYLLSTHAFQNTSSKVNASTLALLTSRKHLIRSKGTALLFKLSQLNIKGKFFDCIHHMYSHSRAKIKMMGKVQVGTEQGHPMSPELFKIFLLDLSKELNDAIGHSTQTPELNNTSLSHLLWADDLVLLALDRTSLQHLINFVHHFCNRWGLEVNIGKTAILVFNKSGRLLKESLIGLKYGDLDIPTDKTYCYLGITVTLSGSLAKTMDMLRMKGLRALFALKSLMDINELKTIPILKLFDALLLPVESYGSPVWMHRTMFVKEILSNRWQTNPKECLKRMARDPIERLHLKFPKWSLGLHKKASNVFFGVIREDAQSLGRSQNKRLTTSRG